MCLAKGQYVFASADRKICISRRDLEEAAAIFVRLVAEWTRKGTCAGSRHTHRLALRSRS